MYKEMILKLNFLISYFEFNVNYLSFLANNIINPIMLSDIGRSSLSCNNACLTLTQEYRICLSSS